MYLLDGEIWMKLKKLAKKGLQAIDIKDIYGQVGIGMLLIYCIKNQ